MCVCGWGRTTHCFFFLVSFTSRNQTNTNAFSACRVGARTFETGTPPAQGVEPPPFPPSESKRCPRMPFLSPSLFSPTRLITMCSFSCCSRPLLACHERARRVASSRPVSLQKSPVLPYLCPSTSVRPHVFVLRTSPSSSFVVLLILRRLSSHSPSSRPPPNRSRRKRRATLLNGWPWRHARSRPSS